MDNHTVRVRRSVGLVALAAALLIGGALDWALTSNHTVLGAAAPVTLRIAPATSSPAPVGQDSYADVLEPLLPAVVNIRSSKTVTSQQRGRSPFEDDPLFRQFFGNPFGGGDDQDQQQPRERRERGLGSGVIVSPDGYILTNNHVVAGASEIEVTLKDKRQLKATVVGADPRTDIAVLKIPATGLATATIGSSTKMRVGDVVLAIGDPFGIGQTVTMGIVSATGRRTLDIEGPGGFEDFIQTDASINPGNSGGALVNTRGELIGINTAIISNGGGGNQGIGFAVPIDMARRVMEQLISTGKVSRGYLGVMIQEVTPGLAKAFNLSSTDGALVGDVTPDSPGAKAGLQKGDVIAAINGQSVSDFRDLRLRVSQTAPGETVKLGIVRSGKKMDLNVKLGELQEKAEAAAATEPKTGESNAIASLGMQVDSLSRDTLQQLDLPANTRGVVVVNVTPDSPAADGSLQRGDVIQEVNRTAVNSVEQFRSAVRAAGSQPLLMLVNRKGTTSYALVSPQ